MHSTRKDSGFVIQNEIACSKLSEIASTLHLVKEMEIRNAEQKKQVFLSLSRL